MVFFYIISEEQKKGTVFQLNMLYFSLFRKFYICSNKLIDKIKNNCISAITNFEFINHFL